MIELIKSGEFKKKKNTCINIIDQILIIRSENSVS